MDLNLALCVDEPPESTDKSSTAEKNAYGEFRNNEAARKLKFMSSSRIRISKHPGREVFNNSIRRVVGEAWPAFFDFSDCVLTKNYSRMRCIAL